MVEEHFKIILTATSYKVWYCIVVIILFLTYCFSCVIISIVIAHAA